MTLQRAIAMADMMKPNAFTPTEKTQWINDCEGKVQLEVFLLASEEVVQYDWETDRSTTLLVRPPHDKLYVSFLAAMIDYWNGEYNKYQNTMTMFNSQWAEFMRWFALNYRPADNIDGRWRQDYYA